MDSTSLSLSLSLLTTQGDLGAIDEQYDVAISTACGALDSIIVDTMDTAVQCVDFLRKQDVGVATFIGLDKMERWKKEAHSKITTYGKNLIKFRSDYHRLLLIV